MSVPFVLFIILLVLMMVVGGKRGAKSFFTLFINFITLFIMLMLIASNIDPLKVTVTGCVIISSITLFYINGFNKKTVSSLISVLFVVLSTMLLTTSMAESAKIQGFAREQAESISYLSLNFHLDFTKIVTCVILLGLIGAIIDVSISISSSMNEVYVNNPAISRRELLMSGINIGKDILGTMTNTLLFAYIGGFMTLIIWFSELKYKVSDIINSKVFCSEVFQILCSGIGITLIIPVTAVVASIIFFMKSPLKPEEDILSRD